MRAIADDKLDMTVEFADEMSYCLGCLACQSACPAGVNYALLFETARSDIERRHLHTGASRAFWRWLTLDLLFTSPRTLRMTGRLMRVYQRSGLEAFVRRLRLTRLLPATLRRLEPQAPRMARAFSNQLIAPHEVPRGETRYKVALLTGCIQDLVFPDINRDTADVLLANGCAVDTPATQPCCGSIHAHNGLLDRAREQARQLIDLMPPDRYDAIITNAGGCGSHLRQYGHLLGRRSAVSGCRTHLGRKAARCTRVAGRDREPRAGSRAVRPRHLSHVSRLVSPRARSKGVGAAARAAPSASRRDCRRAHGIDLVLWQRRRVRADPTRSGGGTPAPEGRSHRRHRRSACRNRKSWLPSADRSRAPRRGGCGSKSSTRSRCWRARTGGKETRRPSMHTHESARPARQTRSVNVLRNWRWGWTG